MRGKWDSNPQPFVFKTNDEFVNLTTSLRDTSFTIFSYSTIELFPRYVVGGAGIEPATHRFR